MSVALAERVTGTQIATHRPLCVDAEGALIRSSPWVETWLALLRTRPGAAWLALLQFVRGGARAVAAYIAAHAQFDAAALAYDESVLERLQEAKAQGRTLVLITTLPASWAAQIGTHLRCIDATLLGEGPPVDGERGKSAVLNARYGVSAFDYVGREDAPAWAYAHGGTVIAANPLAAQTPRSTVRTADVIVRTRATGRTWLRQLRLHQWVKNLLIFVPLIAARRVGDVHMIGTALAAFVAFGCIASASYILNDLFDLPYDRAHPSKRRRPLAAGTLSIRSAAAVMSCLFALGAGIAAVLPVALAVVLLLYLGGTLAYSFFLKRIAPLDAFTLAGLYTLRIFAGNAATGLAPSFWLLAFSMFLFLSLALAKRHTELLRLTATGGRAAQGRGYLASDRDMVSQLGVGSGYISVLVLTLYLNSPQASELYRRPQLLWLLCVLLLYWISRLWLVVHRGQLDDDPVVFALRDRCSRIVALAVVLVLLLA